MTLWIKLLNSLILHVLQRSSRASFSLNLRSKKPPLFFFLLHAVSWHKNEKCPDPNCEITLLTSSGLFFLDLGKAPPRKFSPLMNNLHRMGTFQRSDPFNLLFTSCSLPPRSNILPCDRDPHPARAPINKHHLCRFSFGGPKNNSEGD